MDDQIRASQSAMELARLMMENYLVKGQTSSEESERLYGAVQATTQFYAGLVEKSIEETYSPAFGLNTATIQPGEDREQTFQHFRDAAADLRKECQNNPALGCQSALLIRQTWAKFERVFQLFMAALQCCDDLPKSVQKTQFSAG